MIILLGGRNGDAAAVQGKGSSNNINSALALLATMYETKQGNEIIMVMHNAKTTHQNLSIKMRDAKGPRYAKAEAHAQTAPHICYNKETGQQTTARRRSKTPFHRTFHLPLDFHALRTQTF